MNKAKNHWFVYTTFGINGLTAEEGIFLYCLISYERLKGH